MNESPDSIPKSSKKNGEAHNGFLPSYLAANPPVDVRNGSTKVSHRRSGVVKSAIRKSSMSTRRISEADSRRPPTGFLERSLGQVGGTLDAVTCIASRDTCVSARFIWIRLWSESDVNQFVAKSSQKHEILPCLCPFDGGFAGDHGRIKSSFSAIEVGEPCFP